MIYLNSASHGLPAAATRRAIAAYTAQEAEVGVLEALETVEEKLASVAGLAARLLNANAAQIGFNTTTNAAWLALLQRLPLAGSHVLAAPWEWGDNLRALRHYADATGGRLEILPEDFSAWPAHYRENTAALFLPLVTSVTGRLLPVAEIMSQPRPDGMLTILDAAQALGQIPVDVQALGCDAMVGTTRKWLCGPRGTALFWAGERLGGGATARQLTPTDYNVALRLGLATAIETALEEGIETRRQSIAGLRDHAVNALQNLGLFAQAGQTGALAFTLPEAQAERSFEALAAEGIIIKRPDPAWDEPAAALPPEGAATLRLAANVYNSEADIDAFATILGRSL
ncbi:aminotransferase class V-fold PLP-dependent enzyme [Algicella marina]|uniref:Aminotransferase class V-fold PLP-dependent enzyme n=1 Tax=Algicella marina TaxID=2683284 RepID=A0A6P1T5N9_9RHOB|nr:aminotransferase class V-fold PLP-dependent enzyme [Algicella marina]QHQ37010.1 aminotransferase class V-fold PLP-dependent enzyme [Algicella marina]